MSKMQKAIQDSVHWLINQQNEDGGWGERKGTKTNVLNTAEALLALSEGGAHPIDKPVTRGIKLLLARQVDEGEDSGAWSRRGAPDIVRTSFAIQALVRCGGSESEDAVQRGVDWLLGRRNSDGGWGFRRDSKSDLMPTIYALFALLDSFRAGRIPLRDIIEQGITLLVNEFRHRQGSFGNDPDLLGAHTIHAVLLLQSAKQCKVDLYSELEEPAIRWLMKNPEIGKRLVEEIVPIVPKEDDYRFLYLTDYLLMRALACASDPDQRKSPLLNELLNNLRDKQDEEGGFFGYRSFSYSTSKALLGLSAATAILPEFPPPPVPVAPQVGQVTNFFIVLMAVGAIGLSMVDKFQIVQAVFIGFLMLCALLGNDKLTPVEFRRTISAAARLISSKEGTSD